MKYFVFLLLITSCHPFAVTTLQQPTSIYLQVVEIEAKNICQDRGPAPTMHDEIALFIHLVEAKDKKNWQILQQSYQGYFPMRKKAKITLNNEPLHLQSSRNSAFLALTLVELDGEKDTYSLEQRTKVIGEQLRKGRFVKDDKEKFRLSPWLGADEVLDVLTFNLLELQENPNWELKFEGIDLFDRYEYQVVAKIY